MCKICSYYRTCKFDGKLCWDGTLGYVVSKTSDYGTSNFIVARLSVQSRQLMEPYSVSKEKRERVWEVLHDKVQQKLLSCYGIWSQILSRELEIITKIENNGIQTQSHGRVATIDQIENIEHLAGSFLYSAKSALRDIKVMICEFHENDAEICKIKAKDRNYKELRKWAAKKFGKEDKFVKMISEDFDLWINEVYKKRNAFEHPGGYSGHLKISNFTATQDSESKEWKGVYPQWQRNQDQPASITMDMQITIDNILKFSEDALVHCLYKAGSMVPVVIYEIQKENRDSECPIRLRTAKA